MLSLGSLPLICWDAISRFSTPDMLTCYHLLTWATTRKCVIRTKTRKNVMKATDLCLPWKNKISLKWKISKAGTFEGLKLKLKSFPFWFKGFKGFGHNCKGSSIKKKKKGMPDLQEYPWNHNLINNVENNVVFIDLKNVYFR